VIWGGGIKAAAVAGETGAVQGRGGRIEVQSDLSIDGMPGMWACGDVANIAGADGVTLPQLGSVALQSGECVAENVVAYYGGRAGKPFHYHDKGIMAMIGRGAAIAEVGSHRHELHGVIAFSAWLGVHALLMTGVRNRVDAFISWGWDYFSSSRGPQVLDRSEVARIDWDAGDAPEPEPEPARAAAT
jgi:NADH dehydrogenase